MIMEMEYITAVITMITQGSVDAKYTGKCPERCNTYVSNGTSNI